MKLRKPWLIKTASLLVTKLARCLINSLDVRIRHLGPKDANPHHAAAGDRYIYAFWHENISVMPFFFTRQDVCALVSEHADAQIYADVMRFLRMPCVRGSTNRGAIKAVRKILRRTDRNTHLALATDGPRGPRRQIQPGLPYLASRTGMPVAPIGIGFDRPWRLRSWDKFAVPRPWSFATVIFADPIFVPPNAGKGELEIYRRRLEETLGDVTIMAERWAETGRSPSFSKPDTVTPLLLKGQRQAS